MKRLKGLPPIADDHSRILILGTFPSCESLLQEKYYAHGTNSFWKLLFAVFDKPFSKEYDIRLNLLAETRIAVWDIVESCFREGSSDKKINDPKPNDIPSFLKSHPSVRTLIVTSNEVKRMLFQFFQELKSFNHKQVISSSSGTVGVSFYSKLEKWEQLKAIVNK